MMDRTVKLLLLTATLLLAGCVTSPPSRVDNICSIFDEKSGWYNDAKDAEKLWGSPIPVMMAILYQESRFQPKARPERTKILWVIPGPRKSSAYGYAQAKADTWRWYRTKSGNWGADRDDFGDTIDFVGWYNHMSHKISKVRFDDAYHLYLAYHEGHGGFNRRTFKNKAWLKALAKKVSSRAAIYRRQLNGCQKRLERGWWPF